MSLDIDKCFRGAARATGPRRRLACGYHLITAVFTFSLLLTSSPRAAGDNIMVVEVGGEQEGAEIAKSGHFSLLGDDHHDEILYLDGPSGSTLNSYMVVLADQSFLVPIERLEDDDEGDDNDRYFLFNTSIHGDCIHSDAKFFRKMVNGKIAAFYAIQWSEWPGDVDPEDFGGYDDFRNARIVYEVFRFERRKSTPEWNYPRFRKVAEKRIVVQSCEEAKIGDGVLRLIRDDSAAK
jgi:hypothetical protein